jgi:hypothetical protein
MFGFSVVSHDQVGDIIRLGNTKVHSLSTLEATLVAAVLLDTRRGFAVGSDADTVVNAKARRARKP